MQLHIQAVHFSMSESLQRHADRTVRSAFGRIRDRVDQVFLRVTDTDGHKGAANRRCRLQVALANGENILIEDADTDVYRAIRRVAGRARRVVIRRFNRLRDRRRRRR